MIFKPKTVRRIIKEEVRRALPSCKKDSLTFPSNTLEIELADSEFLRRKGLMHRENIPDGTGMLFVFPTSEMQGFWMKNTHVPLSIAFIDKDAIITNIEDLEPHSEESKMSSRPVSYALEVPSGWFDKNGIHPGTHVEDLLRFQPSKIKEQLTFRRKNHSDWQGWTGGVYESEESEEEDENSESDELESILK